MQKLITRNSRTRETGKEYLFYNLHQNSSVLSGVNVKDLPSVTPLLDGGKARCKKRVFVEKSDQGPQLPGTEKFTPLYLQEPQDHFDFSDPTNDLKLQMLK